MIMDDFDVRNQFLSAAANEPPMALDIDSVVAGGTRRLRRRRLFNTAGGGAVAALAVALPVAVIGSGPGSAGQQPGSGGSPSATDHGQCETQTHSGSTQATAFAAWLLPNLLPQYTLEEGSSASYQTDCADGATLDTVGAGGRVSGSDGDINVTLVRADPAEPIRRPCYRPPNPTATATPPPSPASALHFSYCKTILRSDGSTVTIEEQTATDGEHPYVSRIVIWWRPDGTQVAVFADNGHVLDTSRPNPNQVLTRNQTVALATNRDLLVYLPPQR
jgi:hypothetical protein